MKDKGFAIQSLYKLADYPVLESMAQGRTTAANLDGRACRFIYISEMHRIEPAQVSDQEMAFMRALGVDFKDEKRNMPC